MAISEAFVGSASIGTTEHSMPANAAYNSGSPQTADGWYQLFVDLSALAAADAFEIAIYEKISAAGTQRKVMNPTFAGVQAEPHTALPVLGLLHGWDMTIKKLAGTDRTIAWSIRTAP